jgi:hypothetical protein
MALEDPGSRALAYGQRAIDDPAARVTEDRVTGNGSLAIARADDPGGDETAGGGSATTTATLPSPFSSRLDAKLTEVTAPHPLRTAVDAAAGTKSFKGMAFALADFSTSGVRSYAGSHDNEQRFIASTGKLAILFAAFQLRKAMREAAALITDRAVKKDTHLFDAITRKWSATIRRYFHGSGGNDSLPSLAQIFAATPRNAGGWDIAFSDTPRGGTGAAFTDRLREAVMDSRDDKAASCIRDLGFPYIHGCLAEAGLWERGKGLWIALDYHGGLWWPDTAKDVGSAQAATARTLVELMTLLEFDELVPGSRGEMRDLLSGARAGQHIGARSYVTKALTGQKLTDGERSTIETRTKVGFTVRANTHCDAGIAQRFSIAGKLRYAVAILNAVNEDVATQAARAIDIALLASHVPPPP